MKQWSLFIKGGEGTVCDYVQFLWQEGEGGKQIDYDPMGVKQYDVTFSGTDTYDGFVKWALCCADDMMQNGYEFYLPPAGCLECGTILSAKASGCAGLWHQDNQPSVIQLSDFMRANCPAAVKMADGDAVLAALNVLHTAQNAVSVMWPIAVSHVNAVVNTLRAGGIPIPGDKR